MVRKIAGIVAVVVFVVLTLAGCNVYNYYLDMDAIVGSIYVGTSAAPTVAGSTPFHVLLYEQVTPGDSVVVAADPATVNGLVAVAKLDGAFPGTLADSYSTTTYTLTGVPAGEYFLFLWVDVDQNDIYDHNVDLLGFYEAPYAFDYIWIEPPSPNVIVGETGLLDLDVWVGAWTTLPS